MKTTIITKKIGAGHFEVTVLQNHELVGTFTETSLIDDIHEMINDGFEHELMHFETFQEVEDYCILKAKN
jgi:hypothetical protein